MKNVTFLNFRTHLYAVNAYGQDSTSTNLHPLQQRTDSSRATLQQHSATRVSALPSWHPGHETTLVGPGTPSINQ